MHKVVLILLGLACAGHGRKVHKPTRQNDQMPGDAALQSLAMLLMEQNPTAAFSHAPAGARLSSSSAGRRALQSSWQPMRSMPMYMQENKPAEGSPTEEVDTDADAEIARQEAILKAAADKKKEKNDPLANVDQTLAKVQNRMSIAPEGMRGQKDGDYDLKKTVKQQTKDGVGFNQYDPLLSLSYFVSRRFGIVGGVLLVLAVAAVEGREILISLQDKGPQEATGGIITTKSGLQYKDILVADTGNLPKKGSVIGFDAKVMIGDAVLFDSKAGEKPQPIAFKFGQRPFQNVICEAVEEGMLDMRSGAKRILYVPQNLAPKGVVVPEGQKLVYEIEMREVLPQYF